MKKITAEIVKSDVLIIDGENFTVTSNRYNRSVGMYLLVTNQVPEGDYFSPTDEWEIA